MWSLISTGVPGPQAGSRPPHPLVRTTVVAPVAAAVRTPCTTRRTPRPSYRCVRLPRTSACLAGVPASPRCGSSGSSRRARRPRAPRSPARRGSAAPRRSRPAGPRRRPSPTRARARRRASALLSPGRCSAAAARATSNGSVGRVVQGCDVAHDRRLTRSPGRLGAAEWFPVSTPSQDPAVTRVVVVGGGPGGYEAALVGRRLGADVTVVEAAGLGGSAVLTDVVPSKTLIATAEWMTIADRAPELGIRLDGTRLRRHRARPAAAPHRPRRGQHPRQGARGRAVRGHPRPPRARGRADHPRARPARRTVAGARHHPRRRRRPDARRRRRPRRDRRDPPRCCPRRSPTASASSRGRSCTTCPSCPRS